MSDLTPYTRVSTLAKTLSDGAGLANWKAARAALGVAQRPDLQALAVTAGDDKRAMRDVVEAALAAVGADAAANTGTALHKACELAEAGHDVSSLPEEYRADVDAYMRCLADAGCESVAAERFVVVDELEAAGSFDRILKHPSHGYVIADIKTGGVYALDVATQIACYARGDLYGQGEEITRDRWGRPLIQPPGSDGDPRRGVLAEMGVSLTTGLVIHLERGTGRCALKTVDLAAGWLAAKTAADVRAMRRDARDWIS